MNSIKRGGRIHGSRETIGGGGNQFRLTVIDVETHASIEVVLTPEQWALALWGRGDIEADVEISGFEVTAPPLPPTTGPNPANFAAKRKDWRDV